VVIAGPNGAGKTTFYDFFLASLPLPFVNADQIARTIVPDDPASIAYEAAEVADRKRRELLALRRSFIMETVFSDPAGDKLAFFREAQTDGYSVILIFIGIASPELSTLRVAQRALEGGHDVPPEKLLQRFPRTHRNLETALGFVDVALLFDNSSVDEPFRHVATWRSGEQVFREPDAPEWCPASP
jgi:predicted ABC-type ATPase